MTPYEEAISDFLQDVYIGTQEQIVSQLRRAEIQHSCTMNDLFCALLGLDREGSGWGLTHDLKYLTALADQGITKSKAGEQLKVYFNLKHLLKDVEK